MSDAQQGPGWWQASDGKWYPPEAHSGQQPATAPGGYAQSHQPYGQAPQTVIVQKKGGCLKWIGLATVILVGLVVVAIVIAVAGSNDDDDKKSGSSTATAPPSETYAVGQTAHTGDFDVTLNSVEDPYVSSNQFDRPPTGQRYVATEFTIRNTTDDDQTLSSLLGAEVTDSQARPWRPTLGGVSLPHLDGDVPPGGERRGWIVFAVADDATGLKVRIKGSVTARGSVFVLS